MRPLPALGLILPVLLAAPGAPAAAPALGDDALLDAALRAGAARTVRFAAGADDCLRCRLLAGPENHFPFDEATGRRLHNYPPHRDADFTHMRLELDIDDMNVPTLRGTQTLTLVPIGRPLEELALDARLLNIDSVESTGRSLTFSHDGRTLKVLFTPPVPAGQATTLTTRYSAADPPLGLVWTPESPAWPGRPPQIHTQGQPETNSYWFPCHDFPNERLTTELVVSVPAGFSVLSNGRLASVRKGIGERTTAGGAVNLAPRDRYHWVQDAAAARGNSGDHASYLVSLVVGKFDIVDVGDKNLPMPVYVPPGRGTDVPGTYGKTPDMIAAFGRILEEPYPWTKYAQAAVVNFASGGMENTSATTLYETAIISRQALLDHDLDGLISHELAHQWFGDLVTCNSWEHVWLNEGFATYLTALWYESAKPPYGGPEIYASHVRGNFDSVIASDRPLAPFQPGMVSKVYEHPFEAFSRAANPYSKGASVLHMLRRRLGDEVFFRGVALFIDRFKNRTVETADFRKVLEEVSGESLERFFHQWCVRPGVPTLNIDITWTPDTPTLSGLVKGTLKVAVEQKQSIDAANPAFAFTLPVQVVAPGGGGQPEVRWLSVEVQEKSAFAEIVLDAEPAVVAVDPDMTVLAGMAINQPPARWVNQLKQATTYNARVQAIRALGVPALQEGGDDLLAIAMDARALTPLRIEALRALEGRRDIPRVETAAIAQLTPPAVRVAALEGAAGVAAATADEPGARFRSRMIDLMVRTYRGDRAMKSRAAAVSALGRMKAVEQAALVIEASESESHDDVIRLAALEALGALDAPQGLAPALFLSEPGTLSRTRPKAIETAVRLGAHGRDRVFEMLARLVNDRELRTRRAAREGLASLGDERALAILEKHEAESRGDSDRIHAGQVLRTLRQKIKEKEPRAETPGVIKDGDGD